MELVTLEEVAHLGLTGVFLGICQASNVRQLVAGHSNLGTSNLARNSGVSYVSSLFHLGFAVTYTSLFS